ncbi:unnamed protein product [Rotaria magnacalcarata]|uniref:Uncharacterized protein n=1 Tax=Rotaria magnacalcarata TaxID=392030 RepID=A0A8S2JV75_9BILA|nr:unnamed protein product [Rotaria magnacalcarata]
MLPATAVPPHPLNTLDRIAFYKSVREKRKQLQLNHLTNGKDNESSSTENAFLTQMLQASSNSAASTSISSSLSIPSLLRKGDFSPITSSHRTASSSTLTNILPALLNGTLQSPRALSPPSSGATANAANLNSPTTAAASTSTNNNPNNSSSPEKFRERRKQQQQPESDNNNNHMRSAPSINDQPYRRETYQTLLESSRLLGQHKLLKPVPIDLRKHNGGSRTIDNSPIPSNIRYPSSSSSTSPSGSPSCVSPSKSNNMESVNEYVCIPKKLMPVIGARINDWLERNVNFALSLPVIQETIDNDRDKFALLSRIWHRLLIISMIENSFEIYVTKDLQIPSDVSSTTSSHLPTENDVKQIELLITRGKTLEIDEIGFNLIREVIIYKEGKTLFENSSADSFEKAECHAQSRLTTWCSSRVKYSKIVFFLCNIYQVKEDIFERLFCAGSMHQSTPIHTYLERLLASASSSSSSSMDDA